MSTRKKIDSLMREQRFTGKTIDPDTLCRYAAGVAAVENSIVVVSDLRAGASSIFSGAFAGELGLVDYTGENSIWENDILSLMSDEECEEKYMAELRFYNFLRRIPRNQRSRWHLASALTLRDKDGGAVSVTHRMYYVYEEGNDTIRYAVCHYGPTVAALPARSVAIDAAGGRWHEMNAASDRRILSARELQVLALIEQGMTSSAIAGSLCISKHTVSRHRQEILAKLQAKNSAEACRRAKQLKLI